MKKTLLVLLAGSLLALPLAAQNAATSSSAASGPRTIIPTTPTEDGYFAELLAGAWIFSTTNLAQTIFTETTYQTNGTFSIQGRMEAVAGNSDKPADPLPVQLIAGSGFWRISNGFLYTVVTNSETMPKSQESRYEIMALNRKHFVYRNDAGDFRTALRKP